MAVPWLLPAAIVGAAILARASREPEAVESDPEPSEDVAELEAALSEERERVRDLDRENRALRAGNKAKRNQAKRKKRPAPDPEPAEPEPEPDPEPIEDGPDDSTDSPGGAEESSENETSPETE